MRASAGFCILAALVALGAAFGAQRFLELIPCALCLVERWPWRIVLALGVVAMVLPARPARVVLWGCVLVLFAGTAIGAVHVGVEQGWWRSPLPECAGPDLAGLPMAERLARMPARPSKPCDQADYLIPAVPITMAQADFGASLAVGGLIAISLLRRRRRVA